MPFRDGRFWYESWDDVLMWQDSVVTLDDVIHKACAPMRRYLYEAMTLLGCYLAETNPKRRIELAAEHDRLVMLFHDRHRLCNSSISFACAATMSLYPNGEHLQSHFLHEDSDPDLLERISTCPIQWDANKSYLWQGGKPVDPADYSDSDKEVLASIRLEIIGRVLPAIDAVETAFATIYDLEFVEELTCVEGESWHRVYGERLASLVREISGSTAHPVKGSGTLMVSQAQISRAFQWDKTRVSRAARDGTFPARNANKRYPADLVVEWMRANGQEQRKAWGP